MKKIIKLIVLIGIFGLSWGALAGSYEDFFSAIERDDAPAIERLLQRGFDANSVNPQGTAGLLLAMQKGSFAAVRALLRAKNIQVEVRSPADENPLMFAALRGQRDLVEQLLSLGADVNKPGWTPLHYAATHGDTVIIQMLLDAHAYIDAESPNGSTPLMMAAHYGTPAAVKLLLEAGADPTLKNELGLDALAFARRANREDSAQIIAAFVRGRQPKGSW